MYNHSLLTAVVYSLQYKVRGLHSYCLETAVQLTNTEVDYNCIPLILAINSLSSSTFFLFSFNIPFNNSQCLFYIQQI